MLSPRTLWSVLAGHCSHNEWAWIWAVLFIKTLGTFLHFVVSHSLLSGQKQKFKKLSVIKGVGGLGCAIKDHDHVVPGIVVGVVRPS